MKVSRKADYAIRALLDLAQHDGQGLVQSDDIAHRQGIPAPYLDQVMTTLRKAGIVKSSRGPQGGHTLARPASEIALGEVIGALEGTLSPMDCVDDPDACPQLRYCAQREVWQSVREAVHQVLGATSIGDLARRQQERQGQGRYYI
ncbi:MAG: Rrf2 family transcriptional regulator [Chloroflexi bacterium]|nr:Rrf2 family transcriptional regulator [Chloroflexota bacterium]